MSYENRVYRANRDANGTPTAQDRSLIAVCKDDLFCVVEKYDSERWVCELLQGNREPQGTKFVAHTVWLDEFCTYTHTHTHTHTHEPPCLCETPSMHNRDCAWLVWKRGEENG